MHADQQQPQPDPFKHIADEYRQIRAGKTQAKLVDPAELPRRQTGVRRVDEGFWRQSTSSYAAPPAAKKRRRQTLDKAPRKAIRVAKPGRQASRKSQLVTVLVHFISLFLVTLSDVQLSFSNVSIPWSTPALPPAWSFPKELQIPMT